LVDLAAEATAVAEQVDLKVFRPSSVKDLRRRFCGGGWWPRTEKRTLFNPAKVSTTRYRYRGTAIPTPWPVTG
jgi:RNA-directed DNA polymerase